MTVTLNRPQSEGTIFFAPASSAFWSNSLRILIPGGYSVNKPLKRTVNGSSCEKLTAMRIFDTVLSLFAVQNKGKSVSEYGNNENNLGKRVRWRILYLIAPVANP